MMVSAVLLILAIQRADNASSLLIAIDAVITINVLKINAQQLDAPTLLFSVTMVMHVLMIYVILDLENVSVPQCLLRILINAPSKLVILRKESSTHQRIVMMVLLALSILAVLTVVAPTLQTMVVVMTTIHAQLIPVFKERDVSTLQ
jgi:sRNA-binding carbon storage regulator CsrA